MCDTEVQSTRGLEKAHAELICSQQVETQHGGIEDFASLKESQILVLQDSA